MTIVVYSSHTGSTQKYAQTFADKVGYACYSVKDEYDRNDEIIYFGWLRGPSIVDLNLIDRKKLIAVVSVSIEKDDVLFRKVKESEKIGVPFYNLRGWIDRKKVGFFPKILFIFLAVKYKLKGLDDYTGPMYDAMLNGGSFYDESGLDPIIEFVRSR